MNRVRKFRAWDLKQMTNSGVMFNITTGELVVPEGSGMILMQYTGSNDSNGKEIYEGDVISDWHGTRVVEFNTYDTEQGYDLELDDNDLVILGNIYENPELLKK